MRIKFFFNIMFCVLCSVVLIGCKSAEERAEERFQSALALLEEGDTARAGVEFRNVFELNGAHLEARLAFASMLKEEGDARGAYGNYLRAAEQYPEDLAVRHVLAEMAFENLSWDEFVRHGTAAVDLDAEAARSQAISIGLNYRTTILEDDGPARQALVQPAESLLAQLPNNIILNNLLIDSYIRDRALSKALERLDTLISANPDQRALYTRRLALIAQMQDSEGVETQLKEMVKRFPEDTEIQAMMIRFYVSQQRLDDAESFLRRIASPSDEDPSLFLSLIQFISRTKDEEAVRIEIERAVAENPKPNRFKAMLAMLDFRAGEQDKAIAQMETILAETDPENTDPENEDIKMTLARMLVGTGNQVGAQRLVEETLTQNPSNVDALKMQAGWQLQADDVDQAIANLRVALDTAPEDIQVMNLMYEAYTRLGNIDLAREYLAQAVDASGNAPETSLRYARLLIQEERYLPAEDVLLPALRQAPRDIGLLSTLGQLYLRMEDIPRTTQVIDTLNRIDTEQSRTIANGLQVDVLSRENGNEEALAYLENLANSGDAGLREKLNLLRARLQVGEVDIALTIAQEILAENPNNLQLKQVLANTQAASGDLDTAENTLRQITAAAPAQAVQSWLQLARIAGRQGKPDKAAAIIDEALVATNNSPNILWAKASVLERESNIDGAIAIYEELYAQHSASVIIANNLASLLVTYRDDPESLERAWVVGRRLQNADNPALQDTYGWLLFRRGEFEEALPYLESAAAAMDDPIVEAHLGFVYAALERNAEALEQLQRAVDIAGPADTRERIEAARAEITRLRGLNEN